MWPGYGHVSPLSDGGKIFCVVYAVFGIPLTLILFTALVERLMIVTSLMYRALAAGFGGGEAASRGGRVLYVRLTHVFIVFCVVLVVVFLLPSAVFTIVETDWNFLDAFYYCFISMTTIGLGDYIPGDLPQQPYRPLYKILAARQSPALSPLSSLCLLDFVFLACLIIFCCRCYCRV